MGLRGVFTKDSGGFGFSDVTLYLSRINLKFPIGFAILFNSSHFSRSLVDKSYND